MLTTTLLRRPHGRSDILTASFALFTATHGTFMTNNYDFYKPNLSS